MKFGNGKIGMITIGKKPYDLVEEPSTIGCQHGFAQAQAVNEEGDEFIVFFRVSRFSGLVPWNVEKKDFAKDKLDNVG